MSTKDAPITDFDPPKKAKWNKYAFTCSVLACMTTIILGYDIGVMSGAIIFIEKDFNLSTIQKEVVVGILNLCSLLGALVAGRTSDWIGRRYTVVLAGTIFFVGALLMGFATNYAFLMVGRVQAGVGVGFAGMIAAVYTTEIAPASYRGLLASFPEVFINFGILLGYAANFAFSKLPLHLGWRFMLGLGAVPSIFITLGVLAMPESPRWLVMQGRLGEAKKVLDKTSDSAEESQRRLSEIKEAAGIPEHCNDEVVVVTKSHRGEGVLRDLLLHPTMSVRHILLCGLGIHFFQQSSGIDSVVLYSPEIFKKAGITNNTDQLLATMGVGFTKTIFILVATWQLDKVGRRPLLLSSVAGMIISLIGLGTGLTVIRLSDQKLTWAIALCITTVLSFVAFFSIGLGPMTSVYCSEIFPLRLRAQGVSLGIVVNRVTSGVIAMTFLSLSKGITIGGSFFLYAGIAAVAWAAFYTLYPETRGKTLEEMEVFFGKFFRWRTTMREWNERRSSEVQMKSENIGGSNHP